MQVHLRPMEPDSLGWGMGVCIFDGAFLPGDAELCSSLKTLLRHQTKLWLEEA